MDDILIVGKLDLSVDELSVLKLKSGYHILDNMSEERLEKELGMFSAKMRWQIKKELDEDLGDDEDEVSEEDILLGEEMEARGRMVYDPEANKVLMANRRVTDMGANRKVKLPDPLPVSHECLLNMRLDLYREAYHSYMKSNCSDKGDQSLNLKPCEKRGLKSLKARIKKKE